MILHYEVLYTDLTIITLKSVLLPSRKTKSQILPIFLVSETYFSTTEITSLHFRPEKYVREFFSPKLEKKPSL